MDSSAVHLDSSLNQLQQLQPSPPVDFVSQFLQYPHILEKIFTRLRPVDLRALPVVSQNWRKAVYTVTPIANRRRLKALRRLKKTRRSVGVENWPINIKLANLKRKLNRARALQPINQPQRQLQQPTAQHERIEQPEVVGSPIGRSQHRSLMEVQNTGSLNYTPPTRCIRQVERLFSIDEEYPKEEGRKKQRWTLARVPLKKW